MLKVITKKEVVKKVIFNSMPEKNINDYIVINITMILKYCIILELIIIGSDIIRE